MPLIRVFFTRIVIILNEGFDVLKKHRVADIEIDTFVDGRPDDKSKHVSRGRTPQHRRVGLWMG